MFRRRETRITVLKYIFTNSRIEVKPSIFSASNDVPGSSKMKISDFGKLETESSAKRIAIAANVFSAPLPISIGRGS